MITLKTIAALQLGSVAWDNGKGAVAGFGVRRQRGLAVTYVLKYRTHDGRQRWATIGRHGSPYTPDTARAEAKRRLGEVAAGGDPAAEKQKARKAKTVAEFCDDYLAAFKAGRPTRRGTPKKAATLDGDRGRIERHVKPLLGNLKVAAVTRLDVERFRDGVTEGASAAIIKTGKHGLARIAGGRGTATRAVGMLGALFAYAIECGLRTDNPVRGVIRHKYNERLRRVSSAEYEKLGEALRALPASTWPAARAVPRFLAITGWRRSEALSLRWREVDLASRTARLPDTKTGFSLRPAFAPGL